MRRRDRLPAALDLRAHIRDIPDFPKPGIVFKDLTPLLLHPPALEHTIGLLSRYASDLEVDLVVAAEARGFILGGAIAAQRGRRLHPRPQAGQAAGRDRLGRVHARVRRRRARGPCRRSGRRRARARARRPAGHRRHRARGLRPGRARRRPGRRAARSWSSWPSSTAASSSRATTSARSSVTRRRDRQAQAHGGGRAGRGLGARVRSLLPAALVAAGAARRGGGGRRLDQGAAHAERQDRAGRLHPGRVAAAERRSSGARRSRSRRSRRSWTSR